MKNYLIITITNKNLTKDELNKLSVKNPSEEKLKLYAARYSLFTSTENFTSYFIYYKKKINAKIMPYTFSLFFICLSKILVIILSYDIPDYYFLFLFVFIIIIENLNINKTQTL